MKKIILSLLSLVLVLSPITALAAKKEDTSSTTEEVTKANVYLFRGEGCPHCEEALEYFDSIKDKYDFTLVTYEVWYDENNAAIMQQVASDLGVDASGVPFIVIGDQSFSGYAESYNKDIISAIKAEIKSNNANDVVNNYKDLNAGDTSIEGTDKKEKKSNGVIFLALLILLGGITALVIVAKTSVKED